MELKEDYKITELGLLPKDWDIDYVKNHCSITTGDKNTQNRIDNGNFPFFVRSQTIERINSYSFDGEAVLTAGDGVGTGKIYHYINGKFDFHQRVYKMSNFSNSLDGYYFFLYFSNNFYNRISQMTAKSSVDSVRRDMIADMQIPVPKSINEQKAIAKALSDADAWIQSLTQLIAKKRQIKQGAMQTLLNPYENGKLKDGWKIENLGNCTEIDPENLSSNTDANYAFHYISLEDVNNGLLKSYSMQIFSSAPSRARRVVKSGDVLIGTVRPNLKSHCIIYDRNQNWVCSTGFAVIRCVKKYIHEHFLFSSFYCEFIDKQINTLISGSNYPAISSSDVKELNFSYPSIDEQNRIAEILKDMDSNINFFESKLKKAKQIKQGMMQKLLTGRIRLI